MAEAHELLAAVLTGLREATTSNDISIYDGDVALKPPTDAAGRVLPYLAVWASPGAHPEEARSVARWSGPELSWPLQVTAAAGTQKWCLQASALARATLAALVLPGGARLVETTEAAPVLLDRDVSPVRYFTPLQWRALTS